MPMKLMEKMKIDAVGTGPDKNKSESSEGKKESNPVNVLTKARSSLSLGSTGTAEDMQDLHHGNLSIQAGEIGMGGSRQQNESNRRAAQYVASQNYFNVCATVWVVTRHLSGVWARSQS